MKGSGKKRYNPKELGESRALIEKKVAWAHEDLNMLRTDDVNNISGMTPTCRDPDEGAITQSHLEDDAQVLRLQDFIGKFETVLLHIQNDTYGICSVTGRLIPREHLRVVPHTTKSIEAKFNHDECK